MLLKKGLQGNIPCRIQEGAQAESGKDDF